MQRISITNPQNIIDGTAKKYYFKLRNTGGPKGDKGDKGDTGSRGPQGEPGNAATVYVGSTTTLPVGQDATVENVGTQYNAVLNFGIPQGPRGPQGVKGDPGEPGQKGEPGPRGVKGERGTNATVYVGTTSTLNPGSQATVYNSGTDSNAVLNFGIPKGEKGDTGATGATGATGPAGQNFAPTIVAELPATGDESKLYLTPKAHTTSTATGNPITATVAEEAGTIESFQLDGDTFQQTYTGKNLYNATTAETTTQGLTYSGDTGFIYLNGSRTGDGSINWANGSLPEGTYKLMLQLVSGSITSTSSGGLFYVYGDNITLSPSQLLLSPSNPKGSITLTVSESTTNAHLNSWARETETYSNAVIRYQIVSGTADDYDFEPYVGGIPSPNPDYPQPIQTVTGEQTVTVEGKNKIKSSTTGSIDWQGTTVTYAGNQITIKKSSIGGISANAHTNTVYTPLNANQAYTFSMSYKSGTINLDYTDYWRFYLYAVSADGSISTTNRWTIDIPRTTTTPSASVTFTPSEDFIGYRLGCYIPGASPTTTGDVVFNAQLELGSTASPFAPYSATSYPLDLGSIELCGLGDDGAGGYLYKDSIYKNLTDNKWYVHKAVGKYRLESTKVQSAYARRYRYAKTDIPNSYIPSGSLNFKMLHFTVYAGDTGGIGSVYSGGTMINLKFDEIGDNLSGFQDWVENNNVLLYYPLATPTDTTITDTDLIAELEAIRTAALETGANTITNTATGSNLAGDMEIGYYGYNPTNRYDKFIWLDINDNYEQIGE